MAAENVPAGSDDDRKAESPPNAAIGALRRRLLVESLAMAVSPAAFGLTFGLTAQQTGLSFGESVAMSALVLAGAAQFSALGLLTQGVAWPAIAGLTAMINLRNVLYSASLAPWLLGVSRRRRAAMAHILADETFALSMAHFRRVGRADPDGYWITGLTSVSWVAATGVGFLGAGLVPDPTHLGLDAVFPAAMAGLAVVLADSAPARRAATVAAGAAVGLGLVLPLGPPVVAAAILGPLAVAGWERLRR
jgi:branched chain amino acid efflux pump